MHRDGVNIHMHGRQTAHGDDDANVRRGETGQLSALLAVVDPPQRRINEQEPEKWGRVGGRGPRRHVRAATDLEPPKENSP